MDRCERCGAAIVVGDWPWCPHGPSRFRVDGFEPYFDENLTPDGIWVSSARQRRRIMDANGIDFKEDRDRRVPKGQAPLFFDMKRG